MPSGKTKYRKSKLNSNKRIKIEIENESEEFSCETGFMTLSDDVLLLIFSFLSPEDLLSLSQCCRRFESFTSDRTLWEHIDFRPSVISLVNLKKFIKFFQPSTKYIATSGPSHLKKHSLNPSISKSFLRGVSKNAPNLRTLILENHIIDTSKLLLDDFPPSLWHLGIRDCVFNNIATDKSYFFKIDKLLPNLKILDLSNNDWFVPHSLLALSKSQTLEELNLSGCDVSDCLPYASLAANFGFSNLRILDLRKTYVSDIEVSCFNRTTTLRHLYLESPTFRYSHLSENEVESEEEGDRRGVAGVGGEAERMRLPPATFPISDVTDSSITTFGGGTRNGFGGGGLGGAPHAAPGRPLNGNESVIIIEVGSYPRPPCRLQRLLLRGYRGITDVTLKHVALFLTDLNHLDISGTGCTTAGILHFRKTRPNVELINDPQCTCPQTQSN